MLLDIIQVAWVCGLASAYILRIMLFDPQMPGPFESQIAFVLGSDLRPARPVNLFDRIRRLFGAYTVSGDNELKFWLPWEPRMSVWRCPKCLAFYVSSLPFIPGAVYLVSTHSLRYGVLLAVPAYLAAVFTAQFLVFVQLRVEGE